MGRNESQTTNLESLEPRMLLGSGSWLSAIFFDNVGDTIETAETVTLKNDGSAAFNSRINSANDVDVVRIVAPESGTSNVEQRNLRWWRGSESVNELQVLDAEGDLIDDNTVGSRLTNIVSWSVESGESYYVLGLVCEKDGDGPSALSALRKAVGRAPRKVK